MKTIEENLTPEVSMRIITQSLSNFKKNYREMSKPFLLWGWVIALASLFHFGFIKYSLVTEKYFLLGWLSSIIVWGVFILIGYIFQFVSKAKSKSGTLTLSHLDRYFIILWTVAGPTFGIISFLSIKFGIAPPPFILCVTGMATLITALVLKYKPLIIGGITFFVFSILTAYITNEYQLLLTSLAIILGYIIPGYMLKSAKE